MWPILHPEKRPRCQETVSGIAPGDGYEEGKKQQRGHPQQFLTAARPAKGASSQEPGGQSSSGHSSATKSNSQKPPVHTKDTFYSSTARPRGNTR